MINPEKALLGMVLDSMVPEFIMMDDQDKKALALRWPASQVGHVSRAMVDNKVYEQFHRADPGTQGLRTVETRYY